MESEVLLPIDTLEKPKKWKSLPDGFIEAIDLVKSCASKDEAMFTLTCVHISKDFIEACDTYQAARVLINTPVKQSILVRKDSLIHLKNTSMTHFSETDSWVHFKNKDGLVISCRRYVEEYQTDEITNILKMGGKNVKLPSGLCDAIENAELLAMDNADENIVLLKITAPDDLIIKGTGIYGWYTEKAKIKYSGGKELRFGISPKILIDVLKKQTKIQIGKEVLKVKDGNFSYVSCLEAGK